MIAQSHMYKIEDVLRDTGRYHSVFPKRLILMEIIIKDSRLMYVWFLSYREWVKWVLALAVEKKQMDLLFKLETNNILMR